MDRSKRKLEHIQYALETGQPRLAGFDDISFVHQSLPGIALSEVDLTTKMGELVLSSPIFINAMTGGGGEATEKINRDMAIAARETGIAMAVGSQMSAIKDPSQVDSYKVTRVENPNGIIFGNLGSEANADQALRACEMIAADAMQIHLNVIQELTMPEGDRDFSRVLYNIEEIIKTLHVPVIVKEVGFGMSKETVRQLYSVGVSMVDVGGFGGTNFARIENERRKKRLSYFNKWGISTVASIIEANTVSDDLSIISSGGVVEPLDIVKSLALGANTVGLAGSLLRIYNNEGLPSLIQEITYILEDIRFIMTALGVRNISEVKNAKFVIKGDTHHWLNERGYDSTIFAR